MGTLHTAPEDEASELVRIAGGTKPALDMVMSQFTVLQTRAQLLLTLATLALTITGFSGPKIAAAGSFCRFALATGLVLVLAAVLLILTSGLSIRWVTQFKEKDDLSLIAAALRYRNRKTVLFGWQITLLGLGLLAYVSGVTVYFLIGAP